ncbi:MAG: hypothetical protein QOE01_1074 [Actinomycetota bacterium]|nr:hypothetical protein [Actinomycetota bacterium]
MTAGEGSAIRGMAVEAVETAMGREHRDDAVLERTGGPAGNARLTAWTGLVLLVLAVAELVTLLDVRGLISWHLALGVLLVPPALLKTGTTGWRIVRYYLGDRSYRAAGPPPLLLRLLGPLVVASTLAVLGTGLSLVVLGTDSSRHGFLTVAGQRIDALTLHQASFAVWVVATGLHLLARAVPALQLTVLPDSGGRRVPGPAKRAVALLVTAALAAGGATLVLAKDGGWRSQSSFRDDEGPAQHAPLAP